MNEKVILCDMDLSQLTEYMTENFAVKPFVAGQLYGWLIKGADFADMTNLSKTLRAALSERCVAKPVKIVKTLTAADGTQKFLFELWDGNVVEGVLMKYKYGNTLCISCQVGCRMGCRFCASTLGGLVRNLSAGEMLGEVIAVNALGKDRYVTNVVMMGSGEPLDNYENTVKFINLLCSEQGLNFSQRNISLSTCGIAPQMRRLAEEGLSVNLTVSLHNPDNEQRREIMPVANAYSVEEVISAARYYFEKTGRRIIVEYTLIDGQNDSYSHAMRLAALLKGMSAHVNVIALNPVKETGLKGTSGIKLQKFLQYLEKFGVSATRRRTMGQDVEGACGQLRRSYLRGEHE